MAREQRMESLRHRHHQIEAKIFDEEHRPAPNTETLHQLKREKLHIKDEMYRLDTGQSRAA